MLLTYAIGDVHGRRDLLSALLAAIRGDAGSRPLRIIFLGDLIDRGPQSRQCLDLVIRTLAEYPGSRLILGNHEEFLLNFLDAGTEREAAARRWFPNGGVATLNSYGFGARDRIDTIAERFVRDYPSHIDALRTADWMIESDAYVFVHAGIDPLTPLAGQVPETTRWIRHKFLDFRGALPKTVIHGHTITASSMPELHGNRIAIDTGAVHSGHLTCAVFDGPAPPRFLATDDHGTGIKVSEILPLDYRLQPQGKES
jgi:serine/threonine protein phosphatase 1